MYFYKDVEADIFDILKNILRRDRDFEKNIILSLYTK